MRKSPLHLNCPSINQSAFFLMFCFLLSVLTEPIWLLLSGSSRFNSWIMPNSWTIASETHNQISCSFSLWNQVDHQSPSQTIKHSSTERYRQAFPVLLCSEPSPLPLSGPSHPIPLISPILRNTSSSPLTSIPACPLFLFENNVSCDSGCPFKNTLTYCFCMSMCSCMMVYVPQGTCGSQRTT